MSTDGELPEGWAACALGEAITANYGKALKAEDRQAGNVSVFGSGGIVGKHSATFTTSETVIIGRKGSVGAVFYSADGCWPIDTTYFITEFGPFTPRFLFHLFQSVDLAHLDTSSAIPGLNRDDLYAVSVPLPPVAEQWRIVAAVEAVLAKVRAARERLNRVPAILKRFRQAVLSAACSGRLTADWRAQNPNAETGSQFLARVAPEPAPDSDPADELPETWTRAAFGRITANFDGQRKPVKSDDRAKRRGAYPYYGASGIIDSIDAYLFDGEYLLIGEDGANLLSRSTPLAFQAAGQFWVNNHAHIVQTLGDMPLAYLELFINGFDLQEFVTGSAQPKLTQAALNRIPVPVPPLAEQHEIVARVSALFARADAIEARLSAARAAADRLTQAVLAKAFRGELVPTEAELARRENRTYEPASELLARVRAAREQPAEPKPARKRKAKPDATEFGAG